MNRRKINVEGNSGCALQDANVTMATNGEGELLTSREACFPFQPC